MRTPQRAASVARGQRWLWWARCALCVRCALCDLCVRCALCDLCVRCALCDLCVRCALRASRAEARSALRSARAWARSALAELLACARSTWRVAAARVRSALLLTPLWLVAPGDVVTGAVALDVWPAERETGAVVDATA